MVDSVSNARVFLLSPANCSGERARLLMNPGASFALARQLQSSAGARLRDVFEFMSGLYFRGKLAYVDRFARPPARGAGALVITAGAGLLDLDQRVGPDDLRRFADVPIDPRDPRYREPLERDARTLAKRLGAGVTDRLRFPTAFVGRGDMSRGSLMLRSARDGRELEYLPVPGEPVHAEKSGGPVRSSLAPGSERIRGRRFQ